MSTLILIGLVTFLYFVYLKVKFSYWERRGIKGPKVNPFLPFFGNFFEESSLPPTEIEQKFLKEYGPIFGTYFGFRPVLNISKPEYIKEILSDLKRFPSGGLFEFNDNYLPHSIFLKNGNDWKTVRAAQTHYFTSRKLRNLICHFEKVTNDFMDDLATTIKASKTGDIEIKKLTKFYTIDIIGKVLFAVDCHTFKAQDSLFVKSSTSLAEFDFIDIVMFLLPSKVANFLQNLFNLEPLNNLGDYFKEVLKKRRETGIKYNDLSEILQNAADDDKIELTEKGVIGNILLSYFAGIEAVSNTITHMLMYLADHQEVQDKLHNEISSEFSEGINYDNLTKNKYIDCVVNETLRLGVLFLNISRTTTEDTVVGDLKIEKDTALNLITYLPNVSPDNYENPQTFNPDRFLETVANKDNLFIPFGLGPKHCLGMRLALLEIKYLLVRLLQRYEIVQAKHINTNRTFFRGFNSINEINVSFRERV